MLSIPMVFSSPNICSSAVLQCVYAGLNPTHINHISSTTDVHERFAPQNWYRIWFDFNNFMTSYNITMQARIKQQISKFWDTEKTCWRKRRSKEERYVWLLCLENNRQYFKNFYAVWLQILYEKSEISHRGIRELELLGSCSNFSANFLHDLGYTMCLSTATYRKDA